MLSLWRRLESLLEMIRTTRTLFALPFVLLSMMLAARDFATPGWPGWRTSLLVLAAVLAGRNAARAYNHLADRRFDAQNPRKRDRALPAGRISPAAAWVFVILNAALFVALSFLLNPLAGWLSPAALFVILFYSHSKRFTPGAHFVLGAALAIAPMGAYVAVSGGLSGAPWTLAAALMLWVAGFDIIYSVRDTEYDKMAGLYSFSVVLGDYVALRYAARLHFLMVLALLGFALVRGMGWIFYLGLALCAWLLVREHRIVRGADLDHVDRGFFRLNSLIGITLFLSGALDLLL